MSKVTFGIINYNRLFYLKSCAESLMESTKDYPDTQYICIDDNSAEPGTKEYLETLKDRGWLVINQEDYRNENKKDVDFYQDTEHMNAFAGALNLVLEHTEGEYFVPLQGDMQFVRKGWVNSYVELFEDRDDVGSVVLDAQRKVRLHQSSFTDHYATEDNTFAVDNSRRIGGAGDSFMKTEFAKQVGGWEMDKSKFSGETNFEDHFTLKMNMYFSGKLKPYMPWNPPAILILTDKTGTNARVRGGKRYGNYWEALSDNRYYNWVTDITSLDESSYPQSIEEMVDLNGDWDFPIDTNGNLIKLGKNIDASSYVQEV